MQLFGLFSTKNNGPDKTLPRFEALEERHLPAVDSGLLVATCMTYEEHLRFVEEWENPG